MEFVLPLWFIIALVAAMLTTTTPLLQEKFKADGYALALWNKVFISIPLIPFVLYYGVPTDIKFYGFVFCTAVIYSISDVVYFSAVPKIGSGMMTRLLPSSVMITFIAWFFIDPSLLQHYLSKPVLAVLLVAIMALFVWVATQAKKCDVSWKGVKLIWPVITAACIGPIFTKLAMTHSPPNMGPFAFVAIQGVMMVVCLAVYNTVRKPVARDILFSRNAIQTGLLMGFSTAVIISLKTKATQLVDNPGFVSVVFFTDALWILLFYKLTGRREQGKLWVGMTIVACAFALVLVKSLY